MSEKLECAILNQLTLFAEGSRAKTFRDADIWRGSKGSGADCGESSGELFANFDRITQSWKTLQGCLTGGLEEFSETWPKSGMTRSGTAYRLTPLADLIPESASLLWPTPRASMWKNRRWWVRKIYKGNLEEHGPMVVDPSMKGKPINPHFLEWLMGFPKGWTTVPTSSEVKESATPSSRK